MNETTKYTIAYCIVVFRSIYESAYTSMYMIVLIHEFLNNSELVFRTV